MCFDRMSRIRCLLHLSIDTIESNAGTDRIGRILDNIGRAINARCFSLTATVLPKQRRRAYSGSCKASIDIVC
jgi:hypothetical protein